MTPRALAVVLAGAVAATGSLAGPAPAAKKRCTKGPCAVKKAKKLLTGRVLIRFTDTGSVGVPSSLDQRLHFCRGGRFIYDSVSYLPDVGTYADRTTGTWRVLSARFSRSGKKVRARVRGRPDGSSTSNVVTITSDGRVVRLDGDPVIVERSDLC